MANQPEFAYHAGGENACFGSSIEYTLEDL
jgi:hypothetical protein